MRILDFDPTSLMFSNRYLSADQARYNKYEKWRATPTVPLWKLIPPDIVGLNKLREAAVYSGLKLFPLDSRYPRDFFINEGLISNDELAPEVKITVRLGSSDPLRRMLAHAEQLIAEWYVCGDMEASILLEAYPNRYLTSAFGDGVNAELITSIHRLRLDCRE